MVTRTLARVVVMGALGVLTASGMACGSGSPPQPSPAPEALTVKRMLPDTGPTEGLVTVSITGTGFQPGLTVNLGGPATNVVVSGTTVISATAPAHAEGIVDLTVTNPDGRSVTLAHAYEYVRIAVTSVKPASGLIGKWVRIDGFGFVRGASIVTFGETRATETVFQGDTTIFAVAPAHEPGTVDVGVTNAGAPGATLPGAYTYYPVTLSVTPSVVAPGGQLTVSWTAPSGLSALDWIGLYKIGDSNSHFITYEYAEPRSGSRTFTAPMQPGQYEFRYLVDDEYNDAARSGPITVTAGAFGAARGASTMPTSLAAQRDDRVDARGPAHRPVTRRNRHNHEHDRASPQR